MKAESALLPRVLPDEALKLGSITVHPAYPNLQPFHPPPSVSEAIKALEAESGPQPNGGLYWGIAKRGWFALQLWRFLGIEIGVKARCGLAVQGGTIRHHSFTNVAAAFEAVFSAEETQAWLSKISRTADRVYFVVEIQRIAGAEVTHAIRKSSEVDALVKVPLDQLVSMSQELGLKGGLSWDDFGIHSVKDVNGIFAVAYHEIKIRSKRNGTATGNSSDCLSTAVTWVRAPWVTMGGQAQGKENLMEASLGDGVGLEALAEMVNDAMEEDEEEDEDSD